jgi:hypothetical protein
MKYLGRETEQRGDKLFTYFWDIETSKIICDDNSVMQVTYLSNVVTMNYQNGEITNSIFFRTIEETVEFFNTLEECTVWCHNLDYELFHLLRDLGETNGTVRRNKKGDEQTGIYHEEIQNVILRDKHAPITINLDALPNITFRDSYCLFNKGVAKLGEEIGLPKLDYDYKKVRLPWDELTQYDYDYNERDNIIVAKSLWKYMQDNKIQFDNIPLTFTSFVKMKRKEYIINNFGKKSINKFYFDRNEIINDFEFFELTLKTYQGGLTSSNINETGLFNTKGVYSIDIKSSYPYQMCSRYFPFFSEKNTKKYDGTLADNYFKLGNYKGYFGTFKFTNIRIKNRNYLLPISSSQISKGSVSSDKVTFNGKLLSASELIIPCNNLDIDTINLVYNYDSIECLQIFATNKQRKLRQEEISFLLDAFHKKEKIKEKETIGETLSENEQLMYALAKVFINSMYGVKVTAPIKNSYRILDGEICDIEYFDFNYDDRRKIYNEFIEGQNNFGGSIDIFTDGCYITSYARFMLIDMMNKVVDLGCNVIYADTDSLKFYFQNVSRETIFDMINNTNVNIIKDNKINSRFIKYFKENHVIEHDINMISNLGIWEVENKEPLPLFVTYGAKKYGYITHDKKVKTTIAGCSKKYPSIAINNLSKKENISIEEAFKLVMSIGTKFDTSASGRTVSKLEKRTREEMNHLTYKGRLIHQYGGIIIEDTTYTLGVTLNDSKILGIEKEDDAVMSINIKGDVKFEQK